MTRRYGVTFATHTILAVSPTVLSVRRVNVLWGFRMWMASFIVFLGVAPQNREAEGSLSH